MKNVMFLTVISLLMLSCSGEDDLKSGGGTNVNSVYFEISAVDKLSDGMSTKTPVYSQEPTQHVTRVSVLAFKENTPGGDYLFQKSYDITGWSDGTSFKRFAVPSSDNLPMGNYKFLAIGRDATDQYTVTTPSSSTKFGDMMASVNASGQESEIFSGYSPDTIQSGLGSRVSIEMTRQVAAVLGYFKNIPVTINGDTVKYLRLKTTNSNQQVNITNGTGINTTATPFNIIDVDLSTQATASGGTICAGNNLSSQGVVTVPNSQLNGIFLLPVSGVNMTLGLYNKSGAALKEWSVKDTGNASNLNIMANNFYSLGTKTQAGNTNGGTGNDTSDDDAPIDLLTDQNIVITISPTWSQIHNLIIQ